MNTTNIMNTLSTCPFRLRVGYRDKGRFMERSDESVIPRIFSGVQHALEIEGAMYIGFEDHSSIKRAFDMCTKSSIFTRRMLDPYALHVTLSKHHTTDDITTYFLKYGPIFCTVEHSSPRGRYAFVNFMSRDATLRALDDGNTHIIKGSKAKIRGKVLSATEPIAPRPYSPMRLLQKQALF